MKKLFALLAVVLAVVSCQRDADDLNVAMGGEQEVMLTVSLPEATRANSAEGALGEGNNLLSTHSLRYILEIHYNGKVLREVQTTKSASAVFPVRLAPDKTYTFVAWAYFVNNDNENPFYSINETEGLSNIVFTNWDNNANSELRDAYTCTMTKEFKAGVDLSMTLTRPFAKIRVISTDIADVRKFDLNPTSVEVTYHKSMYTSFDAVTGANVSTTEDFKHVVTLDENHTYADFETNEATLFADYILVDPTDGTVQFTMDVWAGNTLIKSTPFNTPIPVVANKLTTIKGAVLTEGGEVSVKVENDLGELETITIWDGKSLNEPAYDATNKTYTINKASELAWLSASVNNNSVNLSGCTILLNSSLDFGGNEFTPIKNAYNITFNGQGHYISNVTFVGQSTGYAALIELGYGDFKNVTFCNVKSNAAGSGRAGALVGYFTGGSIENVHVKNIELTGFQKLGGLLAYITPDRGEDILVKNCSVENVKISKNEQGEVYQAGGFIGYISSSNACSITLENCEVKGDIIINDTPELEASSSFNFYSAGFIGSIGSTTDATKCAVINLNNCKVGSVTATPALSVSPRSHELFGDCVAEGYDLGGRIPNVINIDGKQYVANGVTKDAEGNFYIANATGLKWVANVVNNTTPYTPTLFDNKYVYLMNDIDLNNEEWIPIGDDRSARTEFHGIFDGQNHTVKNVKITKKTDRDDENKSSYGLFGNVKGTVKNLTVENVSISGAPKFIGALIGRLNDGLVENCHVKNSTVECNNWTIGGLVGQLNNGTIKDCSVEGTTIKGYAAVGGIVGIALNKGGRTIENCTVKNCTIDQNGSFGYGNYDKMFGCIIGSTYSGELTVNLNGCTVENSTIKGTKSERLYGYVKEGDKLYIDNEFVAGFEVAKIGEKTYYNIDEAIENWTNNTTLTLLHDVTLNDVVKIKSTEARTLDLGTYTLTAASGKNAIEVTCEGRSSASYALTVNANATNPGGITAKGKACIYYKKSDSTKDRPIICIYNGVFNGSYSINSISNGNTNCPQIWIYGGTFNANVNLTKNMLRVWGGTFHGWINCTGDSSAYREISGGRFKSWQFMTADALGKFWVGTAKDTYDKGCYVDDEGYLVVGGPVITEETVADYEATYGVTFANKTTYSKWSSYLKYSSAAEHGLYYTNEDWLKTKETDAVSDSTIEE